MYLSSDQLADLIDCAPNSFACMRRWLERNDWPFATSISGFPKVSKAYHDSRLSGTSSATVVKEYELNLGSR